MPWNVQELFLWMGPFHVQEPFMNCSCVVHKFCAWIVHSRFMNSSWSFHQGIVSTKNWRQLNVLLVKWRSYLDINLCVSWVEFSWCFCLFWFLKYFSTVHWCYCSSIKFVKLPGLQNVNKALSMVLSESSESDT